jgi:hypothetical protein
MACRSCDADDLAPVLSLGEMALANSYLDPATPADAEPRFPLTVVRCRACTLVQLTHVVPPEQLFANYLYLSSFSTTMLAHADTLAKRLCAERHLGAGSLVVEVASNDGYLLQSYVRAGVPVLGIEPARNVAAIAESRGVPTVADFFGRDLAARLFAEGRRADVIHANNVMAHVADLNGFIEGMRILLGSDGVVVAESPYLRPFLEKLEFDTIYHEHLYYYSLTALDALFRRHHLAIVDCEPLAIHGGSLRIFARHAAGATPSARVTELLAEEAAWGVASDEPYARFAAGVERLRDEVVAAVRELVRTGKRVCAYGAAAKGTVLLNATGLGKELEFVCDKNPLKQGRLMPGVRVPIVPPTALVEKQPDYCLLLAWNFADEIIAEQREWVMRGGRFVVPLPRVAVVP